MERLRDFTVTETLKKMSALPPPDLEEIKSAWGMFKEEIETLNKYRGGKFVDNDSSVSLTEYLFENQAASFRIDLTKDEVRGDGYHYPCWGEFTKLEIGGIDWLRDKAVNPRHARIFIMLNVCVNPALKDVLRGSQVPFVERDLEEIHWWVVKSGVGYTECAVFWNPVLVNQLREMGEIVPDPTQPRISMPLPISLEALWVLMHELGHLAVDDELKADRYLKYYALLKEYWRLVANSGDTKLAEVNVAMKSLARDNDIMDNETTFVYFTPLLKKWQILDYQHRLRELDRFWRLTIRGF